MFSYYLIQPLDWEFCFFSVDDYKNKIKENYGIKELDNSYNAGKLIKIFSKIDESLSEAMRQWEREFSGHKSELCCPPMIFPIPSGTFNGTASFCIILKRDEDGDTMVYSPMPLPFLE